MRRLFLLLALAASAGIGQGLRIVVEKEPGPEGIPAAAPGVRTKVDFEPDAWFRQLISKDADAQTEALQAAGMEWPGLAGRSEGQLMAVNLDSDEEPERVVVLKGLQAIGVFVFDWDEGSWWKIGSFVCCGPGRALREPFLEVRPVLWFGTSDLILHTGGATGTGVGATELTIYRVWQGRLYSVIRLVESAYNWTGSEETQIAFPGLDRVGETREIRVRRVFSGRNSKPPECLRYIWEAKRFAFVEATQRDRRCR